MSFIDKSLKAIGLERAASKEPATPNISQAPSQRRLFPVTFTSLDSSKAYQQLLGSGRDALIKSVAVQRAVELLSTTTADLVHKSLHIVNDEGERVDPIPAHKQIINLLKYNPNSEESGYEFMCNLMCDYHFTGNCIIALERSGSNIIRMNRMVPESASRKLARNGPVYYQGQIAWDYETEDREFIQRNIVHVRYRNFKGTTLTNNDKWGFAPGPLDSLSDSLLLAPLIDRYILAYFNSDACGLRLSIRSEKELPPTIADQFKEYIREVVAGK